MKKLIKRSLVIAVMFATIVAYSNEYNCSKCKETNSVTNIKIENVNEGSLFTIKDNKGQLLYSELIEKTGTYSKRFDLTNLPDAQYYFELDKQDEIKIIPFKVKSNIAEFMQDEEYNIVKPDITFRNGCVYISKISADEQSWEIEVYYEDYDLAYRERLKDNRKLTRVYDFSSSKKGSYTIVVRSEGRTFKNSVNIP